jgi:hypothetical protein
MRRMIAALAVLLAPVTIQAQWSKDAKGEAVYGFNFTVHGTFECWGFFQPLGQCSVSGNQATLTSGTATATLTFTGVTNAVAVTVPGPNVPLGSLSILYGGTGPFLWPTEMSDRSPLVFTYTLNETGPLVATRFLHARLITSRDRTLLTVACCGEVGAFFEPLFPEPPGLHYGPLIITDVNRVDLLAGVTTQANFTANIGLTPEPSTYALMAAGLLAIGVFRRRRSRR